jgi:DNA (cytosine-5)-methyltransferase 1
LKPKLLDLFCGAGGAAMGYSRAGFDVVGVDIKPQPHYPFEFHQADALTYPLDGFDAYHASPPCQGYSIMLNRPWLRGNEYPKLIAPVREMLSKTAKPYVIENVAGARYRSCLPEGLKAAYLCGHMFELPFYRHRYFETDFFWMQPGHPTHRAVIKSGSMFGSNGGRLGILVTGNGAQKLGVGIGHAVGWHLAAKAMDIDWMNRAELSQAIPPTYTEYIGKYLMAEVQARLITK